MTIVCDICGNVYKDKQPGYYVTGTICNKCYNLKDIDELKKVVKERIERTKKRLKVLEELGFKMTEIKSDLDSFEELLEKEVVVAVFKNKIINFFTKVSTRETGFLFKGIEDKIPEFINEKEKLANEKEKLENQLENLKNREVELTDQISSLSKEIKELNKNTDTLTNENKEFKNQLKKAEKKLKDIKEQKREEGFQDDFSDKSGGWSEYSDEDVERKYEDGEFHMLVKKKHYATGSYRKGAYSDFILEVDVRQVSGEVGYYGVNFREGAGKFYRISVSGKEYRITKFEKETKRTLKDWTESEYIKKGKEINRLKVIAHGSQIMVFVNDEYLTTVTDSSFVKGAVSMIAGTWDEPNVHVHFDNFKVLPIG